ncbi:MAG: hypothetical protein SGJ27_03970 [Candidatus Melainabacteria bacterium]|nr:hypothetical protein [Candidatus Melainabacteria bacterium]
MADQPIKISDPSAEANKPETPASVEAAGANARLNQEATEATKPTTSSTTADKPAEPSATPASTDSPAEKPATSTSEKPAETKPGENPGEKPGEKPAEKEEGDKPAEEEEEELSLYERTLGKVDSFDEIKGLFGRGKKATPADKAKLPGLVVDDPYAKGKLATDAKAAPGDAVAATPTLDTSFKPLEVGKPGIAATDANGSLFNPSSWSWRSLTPDFAEKTVESIGNNIKETAGAGFDWMSDWWDSSQEMLPNLDTAKVVAKGFSNLTADTVLAKGVDATPDQAEQILNSKLPPGVTADQAREMLNFGLLGEKVDFRYNLDTQSSSESDRESGARRTVNADGSTTLRLSNGARVTEDAQGNVTWLFADGVLKESADGKVTSSFGDWQKQQIAASKEISSDLWGLVRESEEDDHKVRGSGIDAQKANDIVSNRMLGDKSFDGQPMTADRVKEFLNGGLPGARTETMDMEGHKGSKVQDLNGVKRIESADGKTVALTFPDGTRVVKNEQGTTWTKQGPDGKAEVLVESPDGKRFSYAHDKVSMQGFTNLDSPSQRVDSTENRKVVDIIGDTYDKFIQEGKTHEEAMEAIAKEQIIGGARRDSEVTDGQRRAGFLQQIDGQWYQVNSNGKDIHLRPVTKGEDGKLAFGDQFSYNKDGGGWIGTDGKPYNGTGPKFKTGPDGAIVVGDNGGLSLKRVGDSVVASGSLHVLTAKGDGTSAFDSTNRVNAAERIRALVTNRVETTMTEDGKVVQEAKVGPAGQLDSTLITINPDTGVITTPQTEITPDGDVRVAGLGGMTFQADGDIVSGSGESIYDHTTSSWSDESGIVGGEFHGMTRLEAAQAMSDANAASGKAISIGSLALSIAKSGNPNALGIMRSLAWAGIAIADAGIGAAQGFAPAVICLSLSKSVACAALNVSEHQSRALSEVTRLGIFDSTTQNQAMIAGSYGSTYITPESAARHFAAARRPELKVVA